MPYVTAPGNINKVLRGMQRLDLPTQVNVEYISRSLDIPGSSARQIVLWLKRTGFVSADEAPTPLYARFRDPSTAALAAMEALRIGYAPLFARNPDMLSLSDMDIGALIMSSTGHGLGSNVVALTIASINGLRAHAGVIRHSAAHVEPPVAAQWYPDAGSGALATNPVAAQSNATPHHANSQQDSIQIALGSAKNASIPLVAKTQGGTSFTIYLALPETSDATVLTAIFKSLKETLLGG